MTYRELIALYRTGKLEEADKQKVAADIERQEAISEYLFETEEIPGIADLDDEECVAEQMSEELAANLAGADAGKEEVYAMEEKFLKMIRGSIRKAFIKMGVCVGGVLLVVILFILFCLPGIVDQFYYQPDKVVAKGEYNLTNQLSLDMAVYSELFLPGKYRNNVMVDSKGYGEYDINIIQNASITGAFYNVAGKVEKGELVLYDVNLLTRPTGNAFEKEVVGMDSNYRGTGPAGSQTEAYEKLQTLDENEYYMAYVTLTEVTSYTEFKEWFDSLKLSTGGVWCAVPEMTENKDGYYATEIIGFEATPSGVCLEFDREQYPHLSLLDAEDETWWETDSESMQTHFVSMLRYMADQEEFCEMIGADKYYIDWEAFAQNVETYGLYTYGFAITAKRDALIQLSEMDEVCYIYTTPIQ